MEEKKHLKYFKVENFKGFDSFEMDDIGQFNLIAGDNNVGKTNLLEALLFDEDVSMLHNNLQYIIRARNQFLSNHSFYFDPREFIFNKNSKSNSITFNVKFQNSDNFRFDLFVKNLIDLRPDEIEAIKKNPFYGLREIKGETFSQQEYFILWTKEDKLEKAIFSTEVANRDNYIPIIYLKNTYDFDIARLFSVLIKENKDIKTEIRENLNLLIEGIEDISLNTAIIPNQTIVVLDKRGISTQMPLSSQGDGGIKFFRILLEMVECKNNRLMIDEIDSGIHFSRFKSYWKAILKSAKMNNVQLFMTTHSLECLNFFKSVLGDDDMLEFQKDSRYFLLRRTPKDEIVADKFEFTQFQHALDMGNEIRGL